MVYMYNNYFDIILCVHMCTCIYKRAQLYRYLEIQFMYELVWSSMVKGVLGVYKPVSLCMVVWCGFV